jgi:F-type H+-transporting ATPase subunit epsilon
MATMEANDTTKSIKCVVVTPEKAVLDTNVDFVAVPMFDGELGVLPGRQALIGRMGYGELRTVQGSTTRRYYIDGGFVQVRKDVVTLLTAKAIPAEQLKAGAAEAALQEALKPATTPESQEAHFKDQQRARAQLRIIHKGEETH